MRRGPAPQREPMDLYFSAPYGLKLLCPFPSTGFSVGRLPLFGAGPLRSPTVRPVPREETWRPEAQGRGGWWQAQAVGELTRRGREGGHRGSNLLTQAGRISPEEPHILTEGLSSSRSLIHRHKVALIRSLINLSRTRNLLLRIKQHLFPLRDPT